MKSKFSDRLTVNHHNLDHFVILAGALGIHSEHDLINSNYIISPQYTKDKYTYYIKTSHFELLVTFYLKKNFVKINQLVSTGQTNNVALKLLIEQVKHLSKSGYDYISLVADRDDNKDIEIGDKVIKPNGYIVWGKYSFLMRNSLEKSLMNIKTFNKFLKDNGRLEKTLYGLLQDKTNGGVEIWAAKGKAWLGRFSLGRSSVSKTRLSEAAKKLTGV